MDVIDPSIRSMLSDCSTDTAANSSINEEDSSCDQLNSSSQLLVSPVRSKIKTKGTKRRCSENNSIKELTCSDDDEEELFSIKKRKKARMKAPCDDESECKC